MWITFYKYLNIYLGEWVRENINIKRVWVRQGHFIRQWTETHCLDQPGWDPTDIPALYLPSLAINIFASALGKIKVSYKNIVSLHKLF